MSFGVYKIYLHLHEKIHKLFFRSVTIKNADENYVTVLNFISKRCEMTTAHHVAETYKKKNKTWKDHMQEWRTGQSSEERKFSFRPSDSKGTMATLFYKGRRIIMTRTLGSTITVGWERKPMEMESLTLTVWGSNHQILLDLLQDALDDAREEQRDELNVWVLGDSWMGGWEKAMSKKLRSSDSVILDGDMSKDLVDDARKFQASAEWYMDRGIPYRRGKRARVRSERKEDARLWRKRMCSAAHVLGRTCARPHMC
jgi:hypothetical protein